MGTELSRKAFFENNGFKMTNPYWAWSGVNEDKKQVIFNVWEHYKERRNGKDRYIVLYDAWKDAVDSQTGFNDSIKNLNLILNKDYQLCIAIAEPTEKFRMPMANEDEEVKIKHIRSSFYFLSELERR